MTTTDLDRATDANRAVDIAETRTEKYRSMLEQVRNQLYRWAKESRRGGWSTHQVDPMRKMAGEISELLATE